MSKRRKRQSRGLVQEAKFESNLPDASGSSSPKEDRDSRRIDVWLQRAAHASQLGLLLFTAWALYFTVIPFYEKALLDEQIAEKQIELAEIQKQFAESYRKIRHIAVEDYAFAAHAECGGLLIPAETLNSYFDKAIARPNIAKATLAIDPRQCLLKEFDRAGKMEELAFADRAFLRARVAAIAEEVEARRQKALARLEGAEAVARSNALAAMKEPVDDATVAGLILVDKGPEFREEFEYWTALQNELWAIASQYRADLHEALSVLEDLTWPTPADEKD